MRAAAARCWPANSRGPARRTFQGSWLLDGDSYDAERRRSPGAEQPPRQLLGAAVAGLGALFAAALFLGLLDHGLPPKPARAEAAPVAAAPLAPGLCFHGPGGELLDFIPAGQRCP